MDSKDRPVSLPLYSTVISSVNYWFHYLINQIIEKKWRKMFKLLSFMISSISGWMREVVWFTDLTANEVLDYTVSIIKFVQKHGFKVICLTADDSKVNQRLFSFFSNSVSLDKPQFISEQLSILFNPVHKYLEKHFGKYPHFSGCNFNIEESQVLESEKNWDFGGFWKRKKSYHVSRSYPFVGKIKNSSRVSYAAAESKIYLYTVC